jgi:hypothetical protein
MPNLEDIAHPQLLWVDVNGPGDASRLYIFTGIAVFNWHVTDDDNWARDPLTIKMNDYRGAPSLVENQIIDHVETASIASIYSRETGRRDAVGFAVDSVYAFFPSEPDQDGRTEYGIEVNMAVRGNNVRFYRVSFQLNISARV